MFDVNESTAKSRNEKFLAQARKQARAKPGINQVAVIAHGLGKMIDELIAYEDVEATEVATAELAIILGCDSHRLKGLRRLYLCFTLAFVEAHPKLTLHDWLDLSRIDSPELRADYASRLHRGPDSYTQFWAEVKRIVNAQPETD